MKQKGNKKKRKTLPVLTMNTANLQMRLRKTCSKTKTKKRNKEKLRVFGVAGKGCAFKPHLYFVQLKRVRLYRTSFPEKLFVRLAGKVRNETVRTYI